MSPKKYERTLTVQGEAADGHLDEAAKGDLDYPAQRVYSQFVIQWPISSVGQVNINRLRKAFKTASNLLTVGLSSTGAKYRRSPRRCFGTGEVISAGYHRGPAGFLKISPLSVVPRILPGLQPPPRYGVYPKHL